MNSRLFCSGVVAAMLLSMLMSCSSSSDAEVLNPSNPDPACEDDSGNRFVDCGNGTVTDTATGLIWLKDAGCLGRHDWSGARSEAAALADGRCGLTDNSSPGDWRLPTLECADIWFCRLDDVSGEFPTILSPDCDPPYVLDTSGNACWTEGDPFSRLHQSDYWSNTANRANLYLAWVAFLKTGYVLASEKTEESWAWPVREGF